MNTIYLEPAMVPAHLRGSYAGKMFKALVCESMTIPITAGLWDGGSRDKYYAIDFATGRQIELPGQMAAPWDTSRRDREITLQPGFAVVEHSIFCGKDMGLTFYVHPENAAKLLPAPVELTPHEKIVLEATASLKSSYGGRDRYDMMRDQRDRDTGGFPSRHEWDVAKQSLISKGLLNKAGAITVAGRNANKR